VTRIQPTPEPPGPPHSDPAHPSPAAGPVRVAAAVVWQGDRVLMTQRPPASAHPLEWEFPGGKIEHGETAEQALVREIREELGVAATPVEHLGGSRHSYAPDFEVEVAFVRCTLDSEAFTPCNEIHAVRWVRPADVDLDEVLAADRAFVRSLAAAGEART